MTTKNSSKKYDIVVFVEALDDRYTNFNLNNNNQYSQAATVCSNNEIYEKRSPSISNYSNKKTHSAILRMFNQFYLNKNNENVLSIAYNDQNQEKQKECGHTKGMILFIGEQSIFVSHSVPKLPLIVNENIFPANGIQKGQHFVCLTIRMDALIILLKHRWNIHPNIYHKFGQDGYLNVGKMADIDAGKFNKDYEKFLTDGLETRGEFKFFIHSRTHSKIKKKKNKDASIWDEVALQYRHDLLVPSFFKEREKCSNCKNSDYLIENIEETFMVDRNEHYVSYYDHSKMGVSDDSNILCFSDLNHTVTQKARGGCVLVFVNKILAEAIQNKFWQ